MKIVTKTGNLLDVTQGHIVHGCNAQGVMGAGVAKAIKQKYPDCFMVYRNEYNTFGLQLGRAYPWTAYCYTDHKIIIWNAITQQFSGLPGRNISYDAIQSCFEQINDSVGNTDDIAKEIHIPMIGAGLGGGNWNIIRTIIEETVEYPITLWILPSK